MAWFIGITKDIGLENLLILELQIKLEKYLIILSKIKNFQDSKRRAHQELITGLPAWESEYDIIHKKNVY